MAVASDCVLVDAPEPGISANEREVRRPEAARLPPAVTRGLGSGPSRIASGTTGTVSYTHLVASVNVGAKQYETEVY